MNVTKKTAEKSTTSEKKVAQKKNTVTKKELEKQLELAKETIQTLEASIDSQKETVETAEDKILRAYAELENFKKRKEAESVKFKSLAIESFLVDLLPILDNLQRAKEQASTDNQDVTQFIEGIELIIKQLYSTFEKQGATPIDALNKPFDPNLHQAVSQQEGEEKNIVLQEMQQGFKLNDKVIRPSMVVISN